MKHFINLFDFFSHSKQPEKDVKAAFDEAVVKEQPIRQLAFCDVLPSYEANEACQVFTDLWIWKLFWSVFQTLSFLMFFLSIESGV